jgi:hypothetical protein
MHLSRMHGRFLFGFITWFGLLALAGGCDKTGGQGGGGLFSRDSKEKWTIRCTRIETPDHNQAAKFLADLLRQVPGLKPQSVQVASDGTGSTIYYGQYEKVASPSGSLIFSDQYQRDFALIQSLVYRQQTPFIFAAPELLQAAEPTAAAPVEGSIATAKGTHSLLIAVFYNTPTFSQRKQTAEDYAKELRKAGYPAYYYHEPLRSFVYVGDFEQSDLIQTKDGQAVYGPRVEQFIARNPEEFKNQTENGHFFRRTLPDGTTITPPSVLVPLPGRPAAREEIPGRQPTMPGMDE